MKNLITIGLPSKGRLKENSVSFFEKNNLKLTSNGGERNYFAQIENLPNIKIIYLHAKEIIQRLGDDTLDIGISGLEGFAFRSPSDRSFIAAAESNALCIHYTSPYISEALKTV